MLKRFKNIYKLSISKASIVGLWIRSISIILAVSTLFALVSYLVSDWQFRRSADKANRLLINQISATIDVEIDSAQKIMRKLLLEKCTAKIAQADDVSDIALTSDKMELIELMELYCLSTDLIDNIYIYFPAQDYIISSSTLAGSEILYCADFKDYVDNYAHGMTYS